MKRDYKFSLFLAGSLALNLSTLFFSQPAVSEEVQSLPSSETLLSCPDKLPILEADKSLLGAEITPGSSDSLGSKASSIDSVVVPQILPSTDQISKTSPTLESNQRLQTSAPLPVPQIKLPTSAPSTSLVPSVEKSLPMAPSAPSNERVIEPIGSIIPASPPLPRTVTSLTSTEDLTPHTRYLSAPLDSSINVAASVVTDNKPSNLDSDVPVNKPSQLQTAIGCVPAVDSAQNGVLSETAETEKTTLSHKNSAIEKSIENAQRSLKGFRPF
jgi:hypothetical protein